MGAKRVVSLDLLRGIAAFSVAIPHFFIYAGRGAFESVSVIAVEIFFVLSGYVLAPQLLLVLNGTKKALRIFLIRRWMRTIPAYFVALLLVSAVFKKIGSEDFYRYLFYIQNLFHQYNNIDYYSIAWSLSVEEWFYVIFPVFMMICVRLTKKKEVGFYFLFACVFIITITIARLFWMADTSSWGDSVRRVVVFRIDSIAYGFLLFLVIEKLGKRPSVLFGLLGFLGSIAIIMGLLKIIDKPIAQLLYPFAAASLGCFSIVACLSFEGNIKSVFVRRISNVAGQTSYAVYLFHTLVIYIMGGMIASSSLTIRFAVFLMGTLTVALGSNYLFEQPILQLRPKYIRDVESENSSVNYSHSENITHVIPS